VADKTDDLIISISTDLTTVKRQLRELGQSVTQSTGGVAKRFNDLGKTIDASMSPIQKRINNMVGIPVPTGIKEWKGALADVAHETELVTRGIKLNRAGMMELQASGVNAFQALASGMSVERVAMMEGAQVIGALVQGTEGLGAKLAAIASPMNLVVAGIVAAGAAIVAYGVSGGESIEKLDDILKAHKANIALLGDAYDKVAEKQQNAAVISAKTANLLIAGDAKKLQAALSAGISNIFNGATETQLSSAMGALTTETVVKSQFAPFAKALEDLNNSAKDATALRAFLDTVTALSAAAPDAAAQLIHMADGANQIAQALPAASQPIDAATDAFTKLQEAISKIAPGDAKDKLQDLFDDAKTGKTGIDDVTSALATLESTNLTLAGPIAALQDLFNKAVAAKNALNPQSQLPTLGTVPPIYSGGGKFIDEQDVLNNRAANTKSQYQIEQEKLAKKNRTPIPRKTADDRFSEDIKSIQARTMALAQERGMLGATYEEQTRLTTSYDLTQKALKEVREEARKKGDQDWQNAQLTPDQIAQINATSEAYAEQAAALKKARDEMQEVSEASRDFAQTFIDDMISGKSAAEALGDALKQLGKRLEDLALDSIFGGGNSGSGLFGRLFGSLFGGGGGSSAPMSLADWGFASGGYTGPGGKNAVAGLVHRGEVVWSQADVARAGGVGMAEALRRGAVPVARGSSGSTTMHVTVQVSGVGDADLLAKTTAGATAAVHSALQDYDTKLPGKVAKFNKYPRQR